MKRIIAILAVLTLAVTASSAPTYKVKFRIHGKISYAYPSARSAIQAKDIVEAQIGKNTVLYVVRSSPPANSMPIYKVRFRLKGSIFYDHVRARSASQAKTITQAKIGHDGKVLSTQREN